MPRAVDWLETAVEALPVAVVVVDEDGRLVLANARAAALLDVREGEPAPSFLRDVAGRAAVGGTMVEETFEMQNGGGESMAVEIRAVPVSGAVVCTVEDLTERSLRERADREFITNAAHQLRTPITAIATAIEVLQGGAKESPEPRDRFLGHIERQTERLVRLARAMLTLSRAERSDIRPPMGPVLLRPLLDSLLEELPVKRDVHFVIDCAADAAAVADGPLLTEALSNLIGNAIDHTDAGTVRVTVTGDEKRTAIAVADTGEGIEASELGRVFERFHRGSGGGAGLGLPIAKAAVEALGGTIEIESTTGVGTTVTVRLRRH